MSPSNKKSFQIVAYTCKMSGGFWHYFVIFSQKGPRNLQNTIFNQIKLNESDGYII